MENISKFTLFNIVVSTPQFWQILTIAITDYLEQEMWERIYFFQRIA
jgi:hypothetical protein